ncbi:hypothetical protein [Clostridium estertheticum]|uniref:hypothetical protein n=1 Tax=Clostridium estertheticum TaxID=238834 RepID=UPI001C6E5762|nr:hypothetical protein [Clostridium estertheticum]MBW9153201.1 hypothetical protein [Clostridium estertheticum]WLC83635.1 hypothetical protein KTC97_16460 [Clostridium estertheticum]
MEKVLNAIREFYKENGYDYVKPIYINSLVEITKDEILEIVEVLKDKGYIVEISWKDGNKCEFYLNDLGKQKILNI